MFENNGSIERKNNENEYMKLPKKKKSLLESKYGRIRKKVDDKKRNSLKIQTIVGKTIELNICLKLKNKRKKR